MPHWFKPVFITSTVSNRWPHDGRAVAATIFCGPQEPAASLFVDDREENVAGARAVGLRAIHAPEPGRLVEYLRNAGVEI